MVVPEQKSYESMPEWLRPTVTQITVPHAAWIDNVPWYASESKIPQEYMTNQLPGQGYETGSLRILMIILITYGQRTSLRRLKYTGRMNCLMLVLKAMVMWSCTPFLRSTFAN